MVMHACMCGCKALIAILHMWARHCHCPPPYRAHQTHACAVPAVPSAGLANPSKVAHRLAQELTQPMSNGRVRPM